MVEKRGAFRRHFTVYPGRYGEEVLESQAIRGDGSVESYGHHGYGGAFFMEKEMLQDVRQVKSSYGAFAALLSDGTVLSWGDPEFSKEAKAFMVIEIIHEEMTEKGAVTEWRRKVMIDQQSHKELAKLETQKRKIDREQAELDACNDIKGIKNAAQEMADDLFEAKHFQQSPAKMQRLAGLSSASEEYGSDNLDVRSQLTDVVQIASTDYAFAAIRKDGSVVTWGDYDYGGDSSAVKDQLQKVRSISSTSEAFAAILEDGTVVAWGGEEYGGDCSMVQHQLTSVKAVQATESAMAALIEDGTVVAWGHPDYGGDCKAFARRLQHVRCIQNSYSTFTAISDDGSVVTWGDPEFVGEGMRPPATMGKVEKVLPSEGAFAAILVDGTVVAWGDAEYGGDCSKVQAELTNVRHLQSNGHAYAAIRGDGSVVTWGDPDFGGDSSYVQDSLKDIRHIQAVIWGGRFYSGRPELEEGAPSDYETQATMGDLCAQRPDGVLVTWGGFRYGGTSCGIQAQLQDVRQIQVTLAGLFAAVLADGSIALTRLGSRSLVSPPWPDFATMQPSRKTSVATLRGRVGSARRRCTHLALAAMRPDVRSTFANPGLII
ncbi:hypothetical protein AK812_SmicGene3149 [Symbiodinium microadriaticum]|uniref:E3 ubiquitin-protein ligase HERC1 n=1 Tax=Symbiodinium microadriaticum TaxID=2951 RepID=A0A1Q9EZR5_SYMMI|nr:hypothetical protein AK812_SmicGene3149 [Symbiodinium microadriaticum]